LKHFAITLINFFLYTMTFFKYLDYFYLLYKIIKWPLRSNSRIEICRKFLDRVDTDLSLSTNYSPRNTLNVHNKHDIVMNVMIIIKQNKRFQLIVFYLKGFFFKRFIYIYIQSV